MPLRPDFSRVSMTLVVTVAIVLSGCSAAPTRPPAVAAVSSANAELYARLDADVRQYNDAQNQLEAGDPAAVDARSQALADLRIAATACAARSGCDSARFIVAYDRLLRVEAGESDTGATDADDTTTENGEPSPVLQAVPEAQRSVALLRNHQLSELIASNGPIKAALEEWLTQMRPQLINTYINYQYLRYQMEPAYRKAGLPEALLFGIMAKESGGRVHAVSRSGAAGPLQFMPATGRRFGLGVVDGFDQRFDPRLEAVANAAYINEQLKAFNDNLELTIAAYNGGEGFVSRLAAAHAADASFWNPKIYFTLSPETREYVPMVLAAAWLFLHPERYNLHFPRVDGAPGHVDLLAPTSLAELTVCLGQAGGMTDGWFRTLRNLNPRLDPQTEQPVGTRIAVPDVLEKPYARSCVSGGPWMKLASDLHDAVLPTPPAAFAAARREPKPRRYTVRRGDTLFGIAHRFGCDNLHELASANRLRAPHYELRPGMELRMPMCRRG